MAKQKAKAGTPTGLTRVAAHELHNLISVIIAEAQLLQASYQQDHPNYMSAVAIERAGRRLEALVDQLVTTWEESRGGPIVNDPKSHFDAGEKH